MTLGKTLQDEKHNKAERRFTFWCLAFVVITGIILGFGIQGSKDPRLHGAASTVANILNWTYFSAWSLSFYPQAILNVVRRSVVGMSFDYQAYNVIGYSFLSINYCLLYFKSSPLRDDYYKRHNKSEPGVEVQDVFFAIHAFVLTLVYIAQIFCCKYKRGSQQLSNFAQWFCAIILFVAAMFLSLVLLNENREPFTRLNLVNKVLPYSKLAVTLVKYFPQVILNFQRKSTVGCNIHNFILDFVGGCLSFLALFMLANITGDWSALTEDVAKLGLGVLAIVFDTIIFYQHWFLYTSRIDPDSDDGDSIGATLLPDK